MAINILNPILQGLQGRQGLLQMQQQQQAMEQAKRQQAMQAQTQDLLKSFAIATQPNASGVVDVNAVNNAIAAMAQVNPELALKLRDRVASKQEKPVNKEFKDGFVFDPVTGELTRPDIVTQIENKKAQGQKLSTDDKFKYNDKITSFLKDTKKINQAANDLIALKENSTPTDQLAAIFKFMKSLDPTSVVREGEQQMARSTGGPADAFIGFINQIKGEGGLTPTAFNNVVNTAIGLSNASVKGSTTEVNNFLNTFGDDIGENFKGKLINRIPKMIDPKAFSEQPKQEESLTTSGGISFTVTGG